MPHEEKIILTLSLQLLQLHAARDFAALAELLDDELEAIDASGARCNKPQFLQHLLESPTQALTLAEIRITLFNDAAFETGLLHSRVGERALSLCYSGLWLHQHNHWRLRGFQLTPQRAPAADK